jgi:hypothetical protein
MRFQDWKTTVNPKVQGSWNLHTELPKGLDFFVLFSSINGVLGSGALAAYNAGNTYQDALAAYRVSQGECAMSIDLGAVPDAGYFVDHSDQLKTVKRVEMLVLTYVREICALMDTVCDSQHPRSSSQTIVGLRPPAHLKHAGNIPLTMSPPFWGHMYNVAPIGDHAGDNIVKMKKDEQLDITEKLAAAGSVVEATELVRVALTRRVSTLLGTPEDRLDEQKPMHSFGIDSLLAIDIRNWVGDVFNVDMPVFDILGGATFSSASRSIVYKAQLAK